MPLGPPRLSRGISPQRLLEVGRGPIPFSQADDNNSFIELHSHILFIPRREFQFDNNQVWPYTLEGKGGYQVIAKMLWLSRAPRERRTDAQPGRNRQRLLPGRPVPVRGDDIGQRRKGVHVWSQCLDGFSWWPQNFDDLPGPGVE